MPDDANDDELPALPIARIEHRGRVVRVLIALALTTLGWLLPVPYAGYAFSLVSFAPALALFAFAADGYPNRRFLLVLGAPAALGMALSAYSCVYVAVNFGGRSVVGILAWTLVTTLVTTLVAVYFGRPRGP